MKQRGKERKETTHKTELKMNKLNLMIHLKSLYTSKIPEGNSSDVLLAASALGASDY